MLELFTKFLSVHQKFLTIFSGFVQAQGLSFEPLSTIRIHRLNQAQIANMDSTIYVHTAPVLPELTMRL